MNKPRSSKDRADPSLPASPALSILNNIFFVLVGVTIAIAGIILFVTQR